MTTRQTAMNNGMSKPGDSKRRKNSNMQLSEQQQPSMREQQQPSMLFCIGVCAAYGATSVAITFANKAVLTSFNFHFELSLILLQLMLGTFCLILIFVSGLITPPTLSVFNIRKTFPLSIWFFIYVLSGLGSLRTLTVPTWSALRRLTSIFILVLDWGVDGKLAPFRIWMSVLVMLTGAIVAAKGDFQGTMHGYSHVLLNCVSSAMYLRAVTQAKRDTGMSELGVLLYTNLACLPLTLSALWYYNEAAAVMQFEGFRDVRFQAALFASAIMAGLLNYLVFLSASVNSPLTTCITGQAKNVVGSLGGFLLWPTPASGNPVHLSGCGIGLAGSIWYAVQKYQERTRPKPTNSNG